MNSKTNDAMLFRIINAKDVFSSCIQTSQELIYINDVMGFLMEHKKDRLRPFRCTKRLVCVHAPPQ